MGGWHTWKYDNQMLHCKVLMQLFIVYQKSIWLCNTHKEIL